MKRKLMLLCAVFFPWLALLICDKPGGALITAFLQVTLIGWIPASMWAIQEVKKIIPKPSKKKA